MNVPKYLQQGDTWAFDLSSELYSSDDYSLAFVIKLANESAITLNSLQNADGTWTVSYPAINTHITTGRYAYQITLVGTKTLTIKKGTLDVLPSLAGTDASFDGRSLAQIMVDKLEIVLEGSADNDLLETQIGTRSFKQMSRNELLRHYSHWKRILSIEQGTTIFTSFDL